MHWNIWQKFFASTIHSESTIQPTMKDELQPLKDELQERIEIAQEAIFEAALAKDMDRVASVASAVNELEASLAKLAQVRKDVSKAMAAFDQLTKANTIRAAPTRLLIRINWRDAGVDRDTEVIDSPTGAEGVTRFVESMVQVYGVRILDTIQRIGSGGSSLVSRTPATDFVNPASGELYGHRPITGTDWYIKTHSATKAKEGLINQIKASLGMPRHSVEVEAIER